MNQSVRVLAGALVALLPGAWANADVTVGIVFAESDEPIDKGNRM